MDKERKAIIKNSDMTEDMQQDAINVATKAIDSYNIEKDIACYIKKEFDRKHKIGAKNDDRKAEAEKKKKEMLEKKKNDKKK